MKIEININPPVGGQKEFKIPVSVKNSLDRINEIKNEIRNCVASPQFCNVKVIQMWDEE